MISEHTKEFP